MKKAKKHQRKHQKPKPSASASSKAIVRVPLPANKPWELKQEEVVLLKNLVCKGASNEEFELCMARARHHRLDPLKQQIWFVPRYDKYAENADGSSGRKQWVAQVGIAGLRHIAARDHKDYGSEDEPVFGPMIEVPWYSKGKIVKQLKVPSSATVSIWKKGAERPTVATVYWEEIYPNLEYAPLVRQMPRLMLGKCAAAQCTRKAYPETGGLYISEEFAGRRPDYTPEGRRIVYSDVEDIPTEGSHEEGVAVAERKVAELREKLGKAVDRALEAPIAKTTFIPDFGKPGDIPPANMGRPVPKDLPPILDHDDIDDVWPKGQTPSTESRGETAPTASEAPRVKAGQGRGSSQRATPAGETHLLSGIIQQANPNAGQKPRLDVLLKVGKVSMWMSAWNRDHWPHLQKGKGQQASLYTERKLGKGDKVFINIVGLLRVGPVEFDEDGKTPVIQNKTREAGQPTLY